MLLRHRVAPSMCFFPPPPTRTRDPCAALRGDGRGLADTSTGDADTDTGPWTFTVSVPAALTQPYGTTGAVTPVLVNSAPPAITLGVAVSAVPGFMLLLSMQLSATFD